MREKALSAERAFVHAAWRSGAEYARRASRSTFLRNVGGTFVNRVLLLAIGFVASVVVARILGPEGRGAYAVAVSIGAIGVQLCNLGLHASNTYAVTRNPELLSTLVMNSILIGMGFGGVIAAVVGGVLLFWPLLGPIHGVLLWLSLCWIPLGLCYLFMQNLLLGIEEVGAYNRIELAGKILSVLMIGALILFGLVTPEAVFVTALLTLGFTLAATLIILKRHAIHAALPSFVLFWENLGYSLRGYVAALFAFVALRLDLLLVQYFLGTEQAGYYSVAVTLTDALYMLPITVGTILFPTLSGMSDDAERWQFTKKVVVIVGLVMISIAIAALFGSRQLINTLYGIAFEPAAGAFVWLVPGIVLLSVSSLLMNYLASVGMPPIVMYSSGTAAIANVGFNLKLIPSFGIQGASLSMTLSAAIMLVMVLLYISLRQMRHPISGREAA